MKKTVITTNGAGKVIRGYTIDDEINTIPMSGELYAYVYWNGSLIQYRVSNNSWYTKKVLWK